MDHYLQKYDVRPRGVRGRVETLSLAHPIDLRPRGAFAFRGKNPNNLGREHGEEGLVAGNLCPLGAGQLVLQALRRGRLDPLLAVEYVLVPGSVFSVADSDFCPSRIPDPNTATKDRGEEKFFFVLPSFL
jgi:hypothetical protein